MVDLPLPVGPVTSARPYGDWIDSIRSVDCRSSRPRPVRFEGDRPLVEDSHDHLLAVDGGDRVDAEVDPLVAGPQRDGAVLRDALLGDVHLRQDLEAGDDHDEDALRRRGQLVEHAVDPEPELAAVLERLEVDVAGAVAQRLLEDLVDHADDPAVGVRGRRGVEVEDVLVVVVLDLPRCTSKSSVPSPMPLVC